MRTRALFLLASALLLAVSYLALALQLLGPSPLPPLLLIGLAWAAAHTCLWGSTIDIYPEAYRAACSGLVGSALNIGPALLPLLFAPLAEKHGATIMLSLSGFAGLTAVCFGVLYRTSSAGRAVRVASSTSSKRRFERVTELEKVGDG